MFSKAEGKYFCLIIIASKAAFISSVMFFVNLFYLSIAFIMKKSLFTEKCNVANIVLKTEEL